MPREPRTRARSIGDVFGREIDFGRSHPHGSNILRKATDRSVIARREELALIDELAAQYLSWRDAAAAVTFSFEDTSEEFVATQTELYTQYRDLLDEPRFDVFDSRGALQPSALEEFCTFLFLPVTDAFKTKLMLGHQDVFKGLYFTSPSFKDFAKLPVPRYPTDNVDFVIAKEITSRFTTDLSDHLETILVPAVAVECKTYLDRPRWNECDLLATNVKRGFPRCKVIILAEFLKLDLNRVNLIGSLVDHIYVLRRTKNVDRKVRRVAGTALGQIHTPAVQAFFNAVVEHLTTDWEAPEDWQASGVLK